MTYLEFQEMGFNRLLLHIYIFFFVKAKKDFTLAIVGIVVGGLAVAIGIAYGGVVAFIHVKKKRKNKYADDYYTRRCNQGNLLTKFLI